MKGVIIYKGKYGATRQYAHWLSEELELQVLQSEDIQGVDLNQYDFLVLGSSVYIGTLQIKKWISDNSSFIQSKKVFMFQVAGTAPEEKEKRMAYNQSSISDIVLARCEIYFLPGRLIIEKLSWWDKFMLKMGARFTNDPAEKKTMLTNYDHVNKESLRPIINSIKQFVSTSKNAIHAK